jgi:hypothetical protein
MIGSRSTPPEALNVRKPCAIEVTGAARAGSGNHVTEELFARRSCKPRAAHVIGSLIQSPLASTRSLALNRYA